MLSDIAIKGAAVAELSLYEWFRETFATQSSVIALPSGTALCIVDVGIDTLKYLVAGVEQLAFSVLNAVGAACIKACTLSDAAESFKKSIVTLCVASPVMLLLSPFKLVGHLCRTLPHLSEARPSNREAEAEARMNWVVFPMRVLV